MYLFADSVVQKQTFKHHAFMFKLRSIQEIHFPYWHIYFQTQKYIYLKQTFNINVLNLKLRSIIEVDYLNLCIYVQTQSIFEADYLTYKIFYGICKFLARFYISLSHHLTRTLKDSCKSLLDEHFVKFLQKTYNNLIRSQKMFARFIFNCLVGILQDLIHKLQASLSTLIVFN